MARSRGLGDVYKRQNHLSTTICMNRCGQQKIVLNCICYFNFAWPALVAQQIEPLKGQKVPVKKVEKLGRGTANSVSLPGRWRDLFGNKPLRHTAETDIHASL
jgi:hypothetical protein